MEDSNSSNNNNKSHLECFICLSNPKNPVATSCGHIFCWKCLKSWMDSQDKLSCPVCKNGIIKDQIVRLFVPNADFDENINDIPKQERINPQVNPNRPGFVK